MEWRQRKKSKSQYPAKPRVYWIFVTKLMGGVNFWLQNYKTEVVMRIAIAELLAFAYILEYLLRLTKLKYIHISS